MTYLTIGTDHLLEEYRQKIMDSNVKCNLKPLGGLWLTKYDDKYPNYSSWMDYLLENIHIMYYKNKQTDLFLQKGVLVTLNNNAKIFELKDRESLAYLINNYQDNEGRISYEKLSRDYDGIDVSVYKIYDANDLRTKMFLANYGVDSLVLFNLDVIESYRKVQIEIEPFDLEEKNSEYYYEIKIDDEVHYINEVSKDYDNLLGNIVLELHDYILNKKEEYKNVSNSKLIYDIFEVVEDKFKEDIDRLVYNEQLERKKLILSLTTKLINK